MKGKKIHTFKAYADMVARYRKAVLPERSDMLALAMVAREERERGMKQGRDPDGNRHIRLKLSTIKAKKKGGAKQPTTPLIYKGYLAKGLTRATKKYGIVIPSKTRTEIAEHHEFGRGQNRVRQTWRIYVEAERRINRLWKKRAVRIQKQMFG